MHVWSARTKHLEGIGISSCVEEGLKMECCKNDVPGVSQTSTRLVNGGDRRQPVHRRTAGLASRVRQIDCMLADIQAHMRILRRERIHLGLVRGALVAKKTQRRRP